MLVIENVWDVLKMIWSQTAVGEIAFCFLQINPPSALLLQLVSFKVDDDELSAFSVQ